MPWPCLCSHSTHSDLVTLPEANGGVKMSTEIFETCPAMGCAQHAGSLCAVCRQPVRSMPTACAQHVGSLASRALCRKCRQNFSELVLPWAARRMPAACAQRVRRMQAGCAQNAVSVCAACAERADSVDSEASEPCRAMACAQHAGRVREGCWQRAHNVRAACWFCRQRG